MGQVVIHAVAPKDARPWENPKLHFCHGRYKNTYTLTPAKGGMRMSCSYCKRYWPHPGGADLLVAWASGFRTAKRMMSDSVDQASVALIGILP